MKSSRSPQTNTEEKAIILNYSLKLICYCFFNKQEEDTGERAIILSFFEDATLEELSSMPGVSKKKAEIIMAFKPFTTWANLVCRYVL